MKKAIVIVLALAAASPAFAREHSHYRSRPVPAPYSHIDSGWGPPTNWNDIEVDVPSGGP
jgi:hypothetical protein